MVDTSPSRRSEAETYINLMRESEARRAEAEATCELMVVEGQARVWLSGGICSPGSAEKTVITIYGPLSHEHRKLLLDVAQEIDKQEDGG